MTTIVVRGRSPLRDVFAKRKKSRPTSAHSPSTAATAAATNETVTGSNPASPLASPASDTFSALSDGSWESNSRAASRAASPSAARSVSPTSATRTHVRSPSLRRQKTMPLSPLLKQDTMPRCRMARAEKMDVVIHDLPFIRDVAPGSARRSLFLQKCRLCCWLYDCSSSSAAAAFAAMTVKEQEAELKARECKRLTMLELISYYTVDRPCFSAEEWAAIFDVIATNIFRPLPPNSYELYVHNRTTTVSSNSTNYHYSPEEDAQRDDSNWEQILYAYELLLRIVSNSTAAATGEADVNPLEIPPPPNAPAPPYPDESTKEQRLQSLQLLFSRFLSRRFLTALIGNIHSEDARERDYVKTILHRTYAHAVHLRPFIRRSISHVLLRATNDSGSNNSSRNSGSSSSGERVHGLSELLEVLGSVITGFAVPLKQSHVSTLLQRTLLPLLKLRHLALIQPQLSYCLLEYVQKEPAIINVVLVAMMKRWPVRSSKKQVLFLQMLEELLDCAATPTAPTEAGCVIRLPILKAAFAQIADAVDSPHFQVSEKAIYLLNADLLKKFVFFGGDYAHKDYRAHILPVIARSMWVNTLLPMHAETLVSQQRKKKGEEEDVIARAPASAADAKGHWNSTIAELTSDAVKLISDFDERLWAKCFAAAEATVREEVEHGPPIPHTEKIERMLQSAQQQEQQDAKPTVFRRRTLNAELMQEAVKTADNLQLRTYKPGAKKG